MYLQQTAILAQLPALQWKYPPDYREESASRGAVPLTFCQCSRNLNLAVPPKEGNYGHTIGGNPILLQFDRAGAAQSMQQ